ncbi:NifU family protein [Streptomyces misionensis]|uniref:NifU family protein n=1 Tax=Streptomyces misionensis TaxID=67331 RepID=A0A5C6IX00_9ACTN|nr:NifU family protein [Streptomyces misionensis]TWV33494.1 NifU family protein [Streptomyces misionensis]
MPEAAERLADQAVEARLARLDEALAALESAPGPALEAVRLLTEVYGEALARVVDGADERLWRRLAGDELVAHLMVLHGIHPEPPEDRAARAVERLRPAVRERGGDLAWAGVEGDVARVRLDSGGSGGGCGGGCGGGSADIVAAVRAAVLAVAPELTDVEIVPGGEERGRAPAFVPLSTVRRAVPQEAR